MNIIQISIVTVASLCNIEIRDTGRTEVRCRCPFCAGSERKFTASINKDKGLFHCHRCGEGLNAVTLYAKVHGVDTQVAYDELIRLE